MSYRHGMVSMSWRPDNQDKENHLYFPHTKGRQSMKSDRVFADPYSASLEFKLNDNSAPHQALGETTNRQRMVIHGSNRTVQIDCE